MSQADVAAFGGDLDGDGRVDNRLGQVITTLGTQGVVTTHTADMIKGGAARLTVEITADDLVDDPTVGVRVVGDEGGQVIEVGGRLEKGTFLSNRTATTKVAGFATLRLPVFADADPSVLPLEGMQLQLRIEGARVSGLVQGAVDQPTAVFAAYEGSVQMLAARPGSHWLYIRVLDAQPRDWVLGREEFIANDLLKSLLAPDLERDGRGMISLGFRIEGRACASGSCLESEVFDRCFDRVRSGDESGVDCGGTCALDCPGGAACSEGADCQSRSCGGDGTCAAPSCSDGVRDGFESDLDCGSACGACANGLHCFDHGDCVSGQCGLPCADDEPFCVPMDATCQPAAL